MSNHTMALARTADIAAALALLTRLPGIPVSSDRGAKAAWAYPIAGIAVGIIAALSGIVAQWLGLPPAVTAGVILTTGILATGAIHEDGLADAADGLWGGHDKTRRLEIMKDSQIGSYGTLALIISIGLRWTALTTLIAHGNLVAPVLVSAILSRAAMPAVMHALPHARDNGLSHRVGRPGRATAGLGIGVALILGSLLVGSGIIAATVVAALTTFAAIAIAKAKIGGQTGDVLGATQQLAEIAVLLTLVATH